MSQFDQPLQSQQEAKEKKKQEYISLAQELSKVREGFIFPGVNPGSYSKLQAVAKEFPEYSAQIDELISRFKTKGMKVVLRTDPKEVGHVYILPLNSEYAEMDNLFPRHLSITTGINEKLKRLILLNKELQNA